MAMGGIATYVFAATALVQEPHLDPGRGNFMKLEIDNDLVGVGSFWTSFTRLLGRSTLDSKGLIAGLGTGSLEDNHLVRYARSRSAPPSNARLPGTRARNTANAA